MIIFDASYMVVFLNKDPAPAADRQGQPVSRFKERVEYLAATLNTSGQQIGIPTPAMAEVLVRAGRGRSQFVSILSDRMRFQLIPFDARAAIEAAELIALIRSKHETWGTHAKVKFDIQIVATAKAEDASIIYSDDQDIENFAKRFKIPVMRICDLPLPPPKEFPKIDTTPIGEQVPLFDLSGPRRHIELETKLELPAKSEGITDDAEPEPAQDASGPSPEASNQHEADPAHPTPVQGSDEGRAQVKPPEKPRPGQQKLQK
jgi:predicted nucleic acid-binding protein